jgi:hypothetical protein
MSPADVPGGLVLDYRLDSGVAVVTVTGEVDVSTSPSLRDGLLRVINDEIPRGLVVNLASVSFLDSTGVASWRNLAPGPGSHALPGTGRALPPGPERPGSHRAGHGVPGL